MIALENVTKRFGTLSVLSKVSLRIDPGELVCIVGPSGAGKSTLLSVLIGAQPITGGSVSVDGVDLRSVPPGALQLFRRRVGIVFQDYKLLPNRTVWENVAFPLEVCGASDAEIERRVPELLRRVNLQSRAKALPRELSGGEKARAAIARAIAHSPLILLADEPTGNLDPLQAQSILDLFKQIHDDGTTIILATHDGSLVEKLQPRIVTLEDGRIVNDSADAKKSRPVQKEEPRTMKVEAEEEPEETVTLEHTRSKKKHAHAAKKKIRITSIHSD